MEKSMMIEKAEKQTAKAPVTRRFIACTQSTGRVGKSTVAEGLISWLRFAGVPFAAIDGDSQHQTLARRYPDKVDTYAVTKSVDDFAKMIQALPPTPVIIVDLPAQATGFLLDASERLQLLDFFERVGIRPTLLIFAADDPTAKESAADTVRFFGDRADYLLVENPARFKSDGFTKTPFAKWFSERKTPTLHIPAITYGTIEAWQSMERKDGQYLSLDKARTASGIHELSRMELDYARNRFLVQFEDFADRLLPDPALIKNKVLRLKEMEKAVVSPLDDPFFKV
jgi:hypothetical protein